MVVKRETPEPWASAMVEAGAVDPRDREQSRPSMSQLGKMAGVHTSTVAGLVFGDRETELQVIEQIAKALKVGVETVSEWAGKARSVAAPYTPPKEADLLTQRQRQALDELIRSIAAGSAKDSTHEQEPEKKTDSPSEGQGQTLKFRRPGAAQVGARRTPGQVAFEDSHGLAARRRLDVDKDRDK